MGAVYTEAQKRAYQKYMKNTDSIRVQVNKGIKEQAKNSAKANGESLSEYVDSAIKTQLNKRPTVLVGRKENPLVAERAAKSMRWGISTITGSDLSAYIDKIILYGSYARHQEKYDSDIDFLVVTKDNIPDTHIKQLDLRGKLGNPPEGLTNVDAHYYTSEQVKYMKSSFLDNVRKEGKVVWDSKN